MYACITDEAIDGACCQLVSLHCLYSDGHTQCSTIKLYTLNLCVVTGSMKYLIDSVSLLCVQVRWYSFQFNMQQVAEELKEAFAALNNVLTCLPARSAHRH